MATRHFDENELTLYYYGEGPRRARVERHLSECAACTALYRDISGALSLIVADEMPPRSEQYGREVWQRLRPNLDLDAGSARLHQFSKFSRFSRLSEFIGFGRFAPLPEFITAAATVAVVAFLGAYLVRSRVSEPVNPPQAASRANSANAANPANPQAISRRILLTSVVDHLDRSERVLTDIMAEELRR